MPVAYLRLADAIGPLRTFKIAQHASAETSISLTK
jgi:hypothetical protein